jgi:hypothetical protein
MFFPRIKTKLKKIWVWLKHNWKAPFIVLVALFTWLVLREKGKASEILEIRSESYRSQIDVINKSHREEIEKRNEILNKYAAIIKELEDEAAINRENLDNNKRKDIKDLVESYHSNPEELAKLLAEKYNLDYVE